MGLPLAMNYNFKKWGNNFKIFKIKKSLPKFENYFRHIDHSQKNGWKDINHNGHVQVSLSKMALWSSYTWG